MARIWVGWWISGVVSAIYIVMIVGSLKRWRWTYWLLLVLGPLNVWSGISQVLTLSGGITGAAPSAVIAAYLALSAGGFAIWIWFVVAAARYGPWAMRRSLGRSGHPA